MFRVKGEGKPMHGLFRSNGEPVASAVADTWGRLGRSRDADGVTRVAFFPTGGGSAAVASDAPTAVPPVQDVGRPVAIPLPQARPAGLAGAAESVAPASGARRSAADRASRPLDLLRHLKADART